jgi:hypothetical protein
LSNCAVINRDAAARAAVVRAIKESPEVGLTPC